jgi:hypothetical protein
MDAQCAISTIARVLARVVIAWVVIFRSRALATVTPENYGLLKVALTMR